MKDLIPFAFESQLIRLFDRDGEPWFVLTDICRALEYRDAFNAARNLDADEKGTHNVSTPGGDQQMVVINESGLYSLILTSRKPAAKRFKKWVTSEVLPTIRKTGGYGTAPTATIAQQRHFIAMIKELKRETDPVIRRSMHDILVMAGNQIGIAVPALESVGRDAPTLSEQIGEFRLALSALDLLLVPYDHSRDPAVIAISLDEVAALFEEHDIAFKVDITLRRALRDAKRAGLVQNKVIRSARDPRRTFRAWLLPTHPATQH